MTDGDFVKDCAIYHGQDLHAIDVKGRVNLPARHRRIAVKKSSWEFWFTPGFDGCIYLWDADGFAAYSERIKSLPTTDKQARRLRRSIFTRTARVEPDNQGRVVIPEQLRREVNLESQVLILGVQDHLELWCPEAYEAYEQEASESPEDFSEKLIF